MGLGDEAVGSGLSVIRSLFLRPHGGGSGALDLGWRGVHAAICFRCFRIYSVRVSRWLLGYAAAR